MTRSRNAGPRGRGFLAALGMTCAVWGPAYAEDPALPPETCRTLTAHRPAGDVEYRPGVDVHGKPVVEADVAPPPVTVPETFSFDITVDLAGRIGLAAPEGMEAKAVAGTVTYDHGALYYNGEPMEGGAEAELRALCVEKE